MSAPALPTTAGTPAPITTPAADAAALERVLFEVKRVIVGQERVVERLLIGLLARGHCLLEGVPGVAKTLAVETLARTVSGSVLPPAVHARPGARPTSSAPGSTGPASERFDTELGPIMANFVLADEINRAPAKVQSALLEVMAERQVSIGGQRYPVPLPFLVLATQNPIESEGVYPLPEAQRDRFLMKINVDYPSPAEEREIVYRMGVEPPVAVGRDHHRRAQPAAGVGRAGVRPPLDRRLRRARRRRHPSPGPARPARRRAVGGLRGQPARQPRPDRRRTGDGAAARPRLRPAAGRPRHRDRRAQPSPGALLRRDRRRSAGRAGRPPGAADDPAAAGRAAAALEPRPTPRRRSRRRRRLPAGASRSTAAPAQPQQPPSRGSLRQPQQPSWEQAR